MFWNRNKRRIAELEQDVKFLRERIERYRADFFDLKTQFNLVNGDNGIEIAEIRSHYEIRRVTDKAGS